MLRFAMLSRRPFSPQDRAAAQVAPLLFAAEKRNRSAPGFANANKRRCPHPAFDIVVFIGITWHANSTEPPPRHDRTTPKPRSLTPRLTGALKLLAEAQALVGRRGRSRNLVGSALLRQHNALSLNGVRFA